MRLYTGTGDGGQTSLPDGVRVAKDDVRVVAGGDIDELNAMIGWCRADARPGTLADGLIEIQRDLFVLGTQLAACGTARRAAAVPAIQPDHVRRLEQWSDDACGVLPRLGNFILPGGSELAARLHLARSVCRRAERSLVTLARTVELPPEALAYMNRLSDLLFAWARLANHQADCSDITWIFSQ